MGDIGRRIRIRNYGRNRLEAESMPLPVPDPQQWRLIAQKTPQFRTVYMTDLVPYRSAGQSCGLINGQWVVEFPVGAAARSLAAQGVAGATLWVRVESKGSHARNLTLWAFRVTRMPPPTNATRLSGKEFDEYTEMAGSSWVGIGGPGTESNGWKRVDVTSGVRHWGGSGPLLLLLDCSGCGRAVRLHLGSGPGGARPFLVLRAAPAGARRVRRRALDCGPDARDQCCKQRFYVSFRALGWDDWIIAPRGYYANYCRGDCGANRTPDTFLTYYSHVLDEYRRLDRLAGLRPCCAPLKFSSMSLIYFGPDTNIIKRDLPKMVVDECGCP